MSTPHLVVLSGVAMTEDYEEINFYTREDGIVSLLIRNTHDSGDWYATTAYRYRKI